MRIIVVGAGVVGLSCAVRLHEAGHRVDVVAPIELALEQEKRVTEQINSLLRIAREENDFASEQFMQWFIKEQVEEVAKMSDLLAVVRRNRDDIEDIEEYVAREQGDDRHDAMAPRIAGA